MTMIYDLDNEYGGVILGDSDTPGAALQVNNNSAGNPAIAVLSTASGNPVDITAINSPARIRTAGGEVSALRVGRTVVSSPTVAPVVIDTLSVASGPVIDFGSFVSITSVVLTTVANTDYAIRVKVGDTYRSIPLFKDAAIIGSAAF